MEIANSLTVRRPPRAGVEHHDEEKELLEEVHERLLAAQPKLERFAFIALTAGAAPLLGLLGTVTGMIKTFKLITVFGTGDASLSSGISGSRSQQSTVSTSLFLHFLPKLS